RIKVLALKSIKGVLRLYKDHAEAIQQYHDVFKDQLRNLIWRRVVFDASAHYKERPSLSDIVHQGIDFNGILLRIRVGKYVLLSDVEKSIPSGAPPCK
ncbi:hypothetical protein GCK32_021527, partial [Trichostrongylus colubriformis]